MKYPFKMYQMQVEDHIFWIAESLSLKGCIGQGDSLEDAQKELEENESVWLETAEEFNMDIPPIPIQKENAYSGKFTVRISPYTHEEAAELAKSQNISLNQYVNDAIVAQNNKLLAVQYVSPELKKEMQTLKMGLFMSVIAKSSGETSYTMYSSPSSVYTMAK